MTKIYLCGGIFNRSDNFAVEWRVKARSLLGGRFTILDPMMRDYRGVEDANVEAIVRGDTEDIHAADILLVNAPEPSWGTAMEVKMAHDLGKRVYVFGAPEKRSPWLTYHATAFFATLSDVAVFLLTRDTTPTHLSQTHNGHPFRWPLVHEGSGSTSGGT